MAKDIFTEEEFSSQEPEYILYSEVTKWMNCGRRARDFNRGDQ
ncbi:MULTISPECIES: hypothetical protein [unclassified Nostoc]|nr:hypothetical protein [Nostoc sp. 'Peltigera membranacea cyanobiont' 213]